MARRKKNEIKAEGVELDQEDKGQENNQDGKAVNFDAEILALANETDAVGVMAAAKKINEAIVAAGLGEGAAEWLKKLDEKVKEMEQVFMQREKIAFLHSEIEALKTWEDKGELQNAAEVLEKEIEGARTSPNGAVDGAIVDNLLVIVKSVVKEREKAIDEAVAELEAIDAREALDEKVAELDEWFEQVQELAENLANGLKKKLEVVRNDTELIDWVSGDKYRNIHRYFQKVSRAANFVGVRVETSLAPRKIKGSNAYLDSKKKRVEEKRELVLQREKLMNKGGGSELANSMDEDIE